MNSDTSAEYSPRRVKPHLTAGCKFYARFPPAMTVCGRLPFTASSVANARALLNVAQKKHEYSTELFISLPDEEARLS